MKNNLSEETFESMRHKPLMIGCACLFAWRRLFVRGHTTSAAAVTDWLWVTEDCLKWRPDDDFSGTITFRFICITKLTQN